MSKMLLLFVYSVGFRLGLLSKGELRGMQNTLSGNQSVQGTTIRFPQRRQ